MSPETLEAFHDTLKKHFKKLKANRDLDNLKVLRNRILTILDNNARKFSDTELKKVSKLRKLLHKMNEDIEIMEQEIAEPIELVDVVREVHDKYKPTEKLSDKEKGKYVLVKMKKDTISYEEELVRLQLELVKLQRYLMQTGKKLLIIFEGRDAAGKGGTIKRFTEMLNPRQHRVVALQKPSDIERGQWYFQRYIAHLPNAGEIVFFDRSWYNRAGVEPVMGFVGKRDYEHFMNEVPTFEKLLVGANTKIVKFYFSVSKYEQAKRFEERRTNPFKQYKLSPVDQFSQQLWDKYTLAEYHNFTRTHSSYAPWIIVHSDDKKQARLNAIKYILSLYKYPDKIDEKYLQIEEGEVETGLERARTLKKEINEDKTLFD